MAKELLHGFHGYLVTDAYAGYEKAEDVLYTLVESARANDLNIYNYLDYLLTELPELDYAWLKEPALLDKYLLWSEELPAGVRMNRKNRKNA